MVHILYSYYNIFNIKYLFTGKIGKNQKLHTRHKTIYSNIIKYLYSCRVYVKNIDS